MDDMIKICENLAEIITCGDIESKEIYNTKFGSKTVRGIANMIYNEWKHFERMKENE